MAMKIEDNLKESWLGFEPRKVTFRYDDPKAIPPAEVTLTNRNDSIVVFKVLIFARMNID